MVRSAVSAIKARTALGSDHVSPYDLKSMPVEAAEEFADLLNQCEAKVSLPLQTLCHHMCTLPKPAGGERVIALVAMVLRVLGRCRRCRLSEWDAAKAGFWDAAVAGSSALRAAVWRNFLDESAGLLGAVVATAHIDIQKFYDSLDPCKLI
eukprot:10341554-Heterocapsa_arctica.AAC.1